VSGQRISTFAFHYNRELNVFNRNSVEMATTVTHDEVRKVHILEPNDDLQDYVLLSEVAKAIGYSGISNMLQSMPKWITKREMTEDEEEVFKKAGVKVNNHTNKTLLLFEDIMPYLDANIMFSKRDMKNDDGTIDFYRAKTNGLLAKNGTVSPVSSSSFDVEKPKKKLKKKKKMKRFVEYSDESSEDSREISMLFGKKRNRMDHQALDLCHTIVKKMKGTPHEEWLKRDIYSHIDKEILTQEDLINDEKNPFGVMLRTYYQLTEAKPREEDQELGQVIDFLRRE